MGAVPEHLHPAIRQELDALVRGERPDSMVWVNRYGRHGATLVRQPDDIWTHEWAESHQVPDGTWHVLLPVWTTDESPSDLTAEVHVGLDGQARLYDLHVL